MAVSVHTAFFYFALPRLRGKAYEAKIFSLSYTQKGTVIP